MKVEKDDVLYHKLISQVKSKVDRCVGMMHTRRRYDYVAELRGTVREGRWACVSLR